MDRVRLLVALVVLLPLLAGMAPLDEALFKAAGEGDARQVEGLLKQGADVNTQNHAGFTPLHAAASAGHEAVVRVLLAKGAQINVADHIIGVTPLHGAASAGHEAVVRLLSEKGATLSGVAKVLGTPLHGAARKGHEAVVRLLLMKGAPINALDQDGKTPLYEAANEGHEAVVRLLLEQGASIDAADEDGDTPLHSAVYGGHEAVVRRLLEQGADVNTQNKRGLTPLHEAASQGHKAVVGLLLEKGAPLNAATKGGVTPLHAAAGADREAVVRRLLEQGAPVNAADEVGATPLHWAASNGHEAVVRLLLEKGADLAARARDGATPLHAAAFGGHPGVVRLLLAHDAYAGVKDNQGYTPLAYARTKGLASLVQLLERAQVAQRPAGRASPRDSQKPSSAMASLVPPPRSDVDSPPLGKVKPRPAAYAVVIGIEQYRNHLPSAEFASQDAKVVAAYLSRVMGYREENVAVLLNERAAKADVEKYIEHWLPNRVEPGSTVFIYFSGHGAPNPKTGEAHLVPYDGDPAFMEATGYPLKRLYEHLNKLPAGEVLVVLDSCFSGAGGRSVIAKGMRPIMTEVENPILAKGKAVVLAASAGQQVSSTYDKKGHGLLTYFFLKGLQGEGDTNKDGTIELTELFHYLKPQVERVARREFNNDQTPQLLGSSGVLHRGVRLVGRASR